ncbi:MAG: transglycosylase SLT domain-containing protein [Syntrophobacteraceae bacterium]|nr:transglycosylase SLT domain-containing protein [Syntrophobacteraceae bacterium]
MRIDRAGCGLLVGVALICIWTCGSSALAQAVVSEPGGFPIPYYPPPSRMELCGEPVPIHVEDVRERFDREFTIVVYSHAQVFLWLKRKERYFPWLEKQLAQSGLPDDLKYVAVAESDLMASAASPAGAMGPWQFIASTGSRFGLTQNRQMDERYDFERSTLSAFRYLQELRATFQNWTLALAAYNCGENRVASEMRKQKASDYYSLKLPLETERYIFRILAIKELLQHPERYGYTLPRGAGYSVQSLDRVTMSLPASLPVLTLAEAAGISFREFKRLNPSYIADEVPAGEHTFRVPGGRGRDFQARMETFKTSDEPSFSYHKVSSGETLVGIASRYKVSAEDLKNWNNLTDTKVKIGQNLKIMR